jgi:hypothetical protein
MKEEFFTEYVIENGKMRQMKVSKKEALKEIEQLLKRDKNFLDIMSKM